MDNVLKWIQDAWMGWSKYTDAGKLVALALAVLLYLGLFVKVRGAKKRLVIYSVIGAVICICPLTAAGVMAYQTRFYDYQWIWSLVPVTALIAMGGTMFLTEQCKPQGGWRTALRNSVVTLASVVIVLLCGSLGEGGVDAAKARADREHAEAVLEEVRVRYGEDVCLWAPAEILEYARLDGSIELYYGRDMWDASLNAYSYEGYSQEQMESYEWMETLDDWDIEISVEETKEHVRRALMDGADCALLPTGMSDWLKEPDSKELLLEQLEFEGAAEVTEIEGFYLVKLRW